MKNNKNKASAFTIIIIFIAIALAGLTLLPKLIVKLNPTQTLPGFSVVFHMPGSSPRVIERDATSKIEGVLSRLQGVKNIYSSSDKNRGIVTVDLDKGVDENYIRFQTSTLIRQIWPNLPENASYPLVQMKYSESKASRSFLTYSINAATSPRYIQRYANQYFKKELSKIDGIYKVEVTGAMPMEWRLEYDSEQLRKFHITVYDIQQAIHKYYTHDFLGLQDMSSRDGKKSWIRVCVAPSKNEDSFDASTVQVKSIGDRIITLDELVTVSRQEAEPTSYYRINGLNSIYLSIYDEEGANQIDVGKRVNQMMNRLELDMPAGYQVHKIYDATEYINKELNKIYFRSFLTVLILLLFVLVISMSFRYLFLILTSLVVNIAVAIIFYYLFKLEIQLYSLAGITISLSLIIDSTIVMTDHYMREHDRRTFTSILAATLTTVGALSIIFFLNDRLRLNLQDFAAVVIINLMVSLFIALFFVPALIDKMGIAKATLYKQSHKSLTHFKIKLKRIVVILSHCYTFVIRVLSRYRVLVFIFFIFLFGLPVYLLPEKLEGEGKWTKLYNKTFGSQEYNLAFRPLVNKYLGGTSGAFTQKVYKSSYFSNNEEVILHARCNLPNGATLQQMNSLIQKVERYLSSLDELKQFETRINSPYDAQINIYFKKEFSDAFPFLLNDNLTQLAISLGYGSWILSGLEGEYFSNDVTEYAGNLALMLRGYNYDELYDLCERFKKILMKHRRIKKVSINPSRLFYINDYKEYEYLFDKRGLIENDIFPYGLFHYLQPTFNDGYYIGNLNTPEGTERINICSKQSDSHDIWAFNNFPLGSNNTYKISKVATSQKTDLPVALLKENQQYQLCLQFNYLGAGDIGRRIMEKEVKKFSKTLPIGYTIEEVNYGPRWGNDDAKQYLLLFLVIGIIFLTTSILFNSLRQPLAIIFVIPISYIGVFLTFLLFKLNFDQGGFASFVLLCGITVNASIYILNEYNSLRKRFPNLSNLRAYIKAWNIKVIPILLTVISTILGFIPFMVGEKQGFWFPLSAGTIGGLVMSLVGVFFLLPIMTVKRSSIVIKKKKKKRSWKRIQFKKREQK